MALLLNLSLYVLILVHANTAQDPIGILRQEFTLKIQNLQDEVKVAKEDAKAAEANSKDAEAIAKAAEANAKAAEAEAIAAKEDAKAAKEDAKAAKEDAKAAKEDAKAAKEEATIANFRAEQALREAKEAKSYSMILQENMDGRHGLREKRGVEERMEELAKQMAPPSCSAWKNLGFRTSDYYRIDPDGNGLGEDPFAVYCDMEKGLTHLNHNSKRLRQAHKCSGPKCSKRHVIYSASNKQIAALLLVSGSCKQKVKIDCLETPLQVGSESLASWKDYLGVEHEYWTGSVEGHMCDCGLTNSCINTTHSCNCDSQMKGEMLTDEGYLSHKQDLPVRTLYFGSESSTTVQINFTVGPLICADKPPVAEVRSCEDLFVSGHRTSQVYLLPSETSNDQIDAVFCNMSDVLLNPRKKERKSVHLSDYVQLQEMINETKQQMGEQIRNLEGKVKDLQERAAPQGYKKVNGLASFIKSVGQKKDWEAARAACLADHPYGKTDLVKIDSQHKNNEVWKAISSGAKIAGWGGWIGLKQKSHWRYEWSQGGELEASTGELENEGSNGNGYQNWFNSEEVDVDGRDSADCVVMWSGNGKWGDYYCTSSARYICEFTP